MNDRIIGFLRDYIKKAHIDYITLSRQSGIECKRIVDIFENSYVMSGSELLYLARALDVKNAELLAFIENVA